jgi:hypothetical protein
MPDPRDAIGALADAADFAGFLRASLVAMTRDAPACAHAMAAALGATSVALIVDGDPLVVRPGPEVVVGATPVARLAAEMHVATTSPALLALLDGTDELYPAILAQRIRVRAAPHHAERLFDALRFFVEGCARSSSAPALLAAYRRATSHRDRRAT